MFCRMTSVCAVTSEPSSSRSSIRRCSSLDRSSASVTTALYFVISPNCLSIISLMALDNPRPVSKSAVQPAMPMTVMTKRFL